MTNDINAMGDIFRCPVCIDGFMIVKKNRDSEDRFLDVQIIDPMEQDAIM